MLKSNFCLVMYKPKTNFCWVFLKYSLDDSTTKRMIRCITAILLAQENDLYRTNESIVTPTINNLLLHTIIAVTFTF